MNLARYFFFGVNPFVWCVVTYTYVSENKININLYFFICANITICGVGLHGNIYDHKCSNFTNLARYVNHSL